MNRWSCCLCVVLSAAPVPVQALATESVHEVAGFDFSSSLSQRRDCSSPRGPSIRELRDHAALRPNGLTARPPNRPVSKLSTLAPVARRSACGGTRGEWESASTKRAKARARLVQGSCAEVRNALPRNTGTQPRTLVELIEDAFQDTSTPARRSGI